MPGALTITPRKLYKEDFDTATTPNQTETVTVAGLGSTPLSKVDAVFISDLPQGANDAGAAAAGCPVGSLYYNTTTGKVHARLS